MSARTEGSGLSIDVDHLPDDAFSVKFDADEGARDAIAQRLGMPRLTQFQAAFEVSRAGKGAVWVDGTLRAEGEQTCVVTLEPLPVALDCGFSGMCVPSDSPELAREDVTLEDDDVEILGEIVDGVVDLAEIAVQQLSLELDPFPRKEGAEAAYGRRPEDAEEAEADSPFAALAALKKTLK